ncbi:MAG: DUF4037 domain-containing protein [Desulfatibacillum sp.]|nr:DUF4037 domain-containing protein [Desulfatibacillum sp.]
MQGLELNRLYFFEHGLPMLEKDFPHLLERLAAGLVGDGSECFGFDDALSRDHDWGPGFCLWLGKDDFQKFGQALHNALDRLPQSYKGYGPRTQSQWGEGRVGVLCTEAFYQQYTGLEHPPQTLDQWLSLPENTLAACTNGQVFLDRQGDFSTWRQALLEFYPEDVRLKKIASRCMTIGQSGQYNFLRCAKRGHVFSTLYSLVKFCADVLSLVFLLNRRYAPYYKWGHNASKTLPILGSAIYEAVRELLLCQDINKQERLVEEISWLLVGELRNQKLTDLGSDFLTDHGPRVQLRIQDPDLAARNVWVG